MRGRRLLLWGGIAVTVLSAYLAVRNADLGEVRRALETSDYWWLIPAFAALAVAVVMRAVRWRSLFAPATRPPFAAVMRALLIGYLFNNVLPARAGEAARIIALRTDAGTSAAEGTATVVTERIYDVLVLLALLFVATPWLPAVSWLRAAAFVGLLIVAGVVAAIIVFGRYRERPLRWLMRPLTRIPVISIERADAAAANVGQGLVGFRDRRVAATALFWTVLSWLVLALSAWLVTFGFHLELSPAAGILVIVATNLALVLPSSPAAVGVFEAATLVALDAYDIPASSALSYALVYHALNLFPYVLVGLAVVAMQARSTRPAAETGVDA